MLFKIPTQLFAPYLPAFVLLTASLLTFPVSVHGQTKPKPTPTTTAQPKAPTKQTKDWWVPGLLGGSIMVAGVGAVFMIKRSPTTITEPPEPILYKPSETITTSTSALPAPKPWQPKSPVTPAPSNSPAIEPPEEPKLELVNKPDSETATFVPTVRMPRVSVMDSLVHELRNPDPAKRQKAIWELGRRGDSRAVQPMVDLLLDSDSRQRSLILSALSEISTRTLKPMSRALAISMQDENPDVRKNAIRDLTRIYDSLTRISQLIQNACEDPDQEVQDTAKWAIGQINRIKSPVIQGAGRSVSQPESLN